MYRSYEYSKEFNNHNLSLKWTQYDIEKAKADPLLYLSDWLSMTFDCDFIGETYCLSNYETGHTIYNFYSDVTYIFPWRFLDDLLDGKRVRLFANVPDEYDREIINTEYDVLTV